ncbi:WD40 repeat protein [Algoriphagus ratkowskyi]|uniref:DUF3748 domain-containing protein n=1 Tax=Algoriphagus ratkowskyi TaxID=57028 RepID=A0A2W7QYQ8_9BACT|nr:DUF3748 domain-containing protein [Algoriphagus ratkowskyi]PZX53071.1 WD40 repeat protein [Algoriphagus ratkowskyi]TXD76352.1 DUF3748 domain-containing protein [Algoriphagus ratkowskyi]
MLEIGKEVQITTAAAGHFLNQRQAFSPDDKSLVFDNRNDDSKIGENGSIQLVHIASKRVETVYEIPNQSVFGPGSGAVSFHPSKKEIVFINGLNSASESIPYGFTRRIAMKVDLEKDNQFERVEARDVLAPYTKGALRGGSHAYSYSADGQMLSFTYNDAVLAEESLSNPEVQDLRTVGAFLLNEKVDISGENNEENFDGSGFAVLLAEVHSAPKSGSDEISKAYEECWVGNAGYTKLDGTIQKRAMAFVGDVLSVSGEKVAEVFIADIPEDISNLMSSVNAGTKTALPSFPEGVIQRRLTYTTDNKNPGVQGPRQWMRSSPDGSSLYFYQKDDAGIIQIYSVSASGSEIKAVTSNDFSADTAFGLSADGKYLAYGAEEAIYVTAVIDGKRTLVLPAPAYSSTSLSNINWSNTGLTIAYNRKLNQDGEAFYQIFTLDLSKQLN